MEGLVDVGNPIPCQHTQCFERPRSINETGAETETKNAVHLVYRTTSLVVVVAVKFLFSSQSEDVS